MKKIIIIVLALIIITAVVVVLNSNPESSERQRGDVILKDVKLDNEARVQGDPSANKYDLGTNEINNDTDTDCGEGTSLEDGTCNPEALDEDDDNDSIPTEESSVDGESQKDADATDYNSSRSNRTTDN